MSLGEVVRGTRFAVHYEPLQLINVQKVIPCQLDDFIASVYNILDGVAVGGKVSDVTIESNGFFQCC